MFSKYELYSTVESPYCYSGSNVLRNHLNIRDSAALKAAEEEITALKQYELLKNPIWGRFSKTHLCRIHRFLFEDIYPFAGHFRREQIGKSDTWFYPPGMINTAMEKVCGMVQSEKCWINQPEEIQIDRFAFVMAELNMIHPFREGNGRAIREFIRVLALHNGYLLNWGLTDREAVLTAAVASVDDYRALIPLLKNCIDRN